MTDADPQLGHGPHGSLPSALDLDDLLAEIRLRAAGARQSQERLAALLDAVVAVSSNLDLPTVLTRVVEAARALTDARYGALGVLDETGGRITEFVVTGMSEAARDALGEPPSGHGVLGLLLRDPLPLRIPDVAAHPMSAGFPPGHPPMRSFLGAPVRVRDRVFGNIYLTDKSEGRDFGVEDEAVLAALSAAAGIAIENAQLYRRATRHQQWSQAITDLTQTLLEGRNERSALARMVKRSRELGAAELGLMAIVGEDGVLSIQAVDCRVPQARGLVGERLANHLWRLVLTSRVPLLLFSAPEDQHAGELTAELRQGAGLPSAGWTVIAPIAVGEVEVGLIALSWDADRQLDASETMAALTAFGGQMGLAIEASRAQAQRSRSALLEDRDRIARDMHDHVIQRLYATGLSLQSLSRMSQGPAQVKVELAVDELDAAIKDIRKAIFELHRPIPDGGLGPELEALVERASPGLGFLPDVTFEGLLADIPVEVADDVLAVVREALSNIARHAHATDARVWVSSSSDVVIRVRDNGVGVSAPAPRSGLANLADRAVARGGRLTLTPVVPRGVELEWRVPRGDGGNTPATLGDAGDGVPRSSPGAYAEGHVGH